MRKLFILFFGLIIFVSCSVLNIIPSKKIYKISFGNINKSALSFLDLYVSKCDENGNWLWVLLAGGEDNNSEVFSNGIAINENGECFITGFFWGDLTIGDSILTLDNEEDNSSIFVAKCNSNGSWDYGIQGHGQYGEWAYDIAIDNNDNCYITGVFDGTAEFGDDVLSSTWDTNLFIAKLSSDKEWLFATQTSGNSSADPYSILIDPQNNIFLTGVFYNLFPTVAARAAGKGRAGCTPD